MTKIIPNSKIAESKIISWIFLSTYFASQKSPADHKEISNVADGINHSVPTHDELDGSLNWLIKNGMVTNIDNRYLITDLGKKVIIEIENNHKSLIDIWMNLESEVEKKIKN